MKSKLELFNKEIFLCFSSSSCRFNSHCPPPANGDEIHKRVKNILRTHSARQRLVFVSLTQTKYFLFSKMVEEDNCTYSLGSVMMSFQANFIVEMGIQYISWTFSCWFQWSPYVDPLETGGLLIGYRGQFFIWFPSFQFNQKICWSSIKVHEGLNMLCSCTSTAACVQLFVELILCFKCMLFSLLIIWLSMKSNEAMPGTRIFCPWGWWNFEV